MSRDYLPLAQCCNDEHDPHMTKKSTEFSATRIGFFVEYLEIEDNFTNCMKQMHLQKQFLVKNGLKY